MQCIPLNARRKGGLEEHPSSHKITQATVSPLGQKTKSHKLTHITNNSFPIQSPHATITNCLPPYSSFCQVRHSFTYRSTVYTMLLVPNITQYHRSRFDTISPQPHTQLEEKGRKISFPEPPKPQSTQIKYSTTTNPTKFATFCYHPTHPTHCFPFITNHHRKITYTLTLGKQ